MSDDSQEVVYRQVHLYQRTRVALWMLLISSSALLGLLWYYQWLQKNPQNIRYVDADKPAPHEQKNSAAQPGEQRTVVAPAGEPSEANMLLAEIELYQYLQKQDPTLDRRKVAAALKPYTFSKNAAVREAAQHELRELISGMEEALRGPAENVMNEARELAKAQKFPVAIERIEATLKTIPDDVPWGENTIVQRLRKLSDEISSIRKKERDGALDGLEAGLRNNDANARARLKALNEHPDPTFKAAAAAIHEKVFHELEIKNAERRKAELAGREAWMQFFRRLSATISEGEISTAAELCENPPFDGMLHGGVPTPDKVLKGWAAEVASIQTMHDVALRTIKNSHKTVDLQLRRGAVAGTLLSVNGRQLKIKTLNNAEVGIKIGDVRSGSMRQLLEGNAVSVQHALWALEAHETPADAENLLRKNYGAESLPLQWAERIKLEKLIGQLNSFSTLTQSMNAAIEQKEYTEIKKLLEQLKPLLFVPEIALAVTPEHRALFENADRLSKKLELLRVVLQNGVSPTPQFNGINTDQISEYRDNSRRTDIGVQFGLKLGASGGLQRVLLRFDGIEEHLKNARVRKAVLEIYQTESPQATGAGIGLFRLKRAWKAENGTWMCFDESKKQEWAIPGASGANDIEPKEDFSMVLDKEKNCWRSFDITKYVQEVLGGTAQNNGFLIKVTNGEPDFHVRFYPETDMDRPKDASLRPKLTLDIEREKEAQVE